MGTQSPSPPMEVDQIKISKKFDGEGSKISEDRTTKFHISRGEGARFVIVTQGKKRYNKYLHS